MTETPLLSATGIRKSFGGVEVLHGVDLHLRPGEVLALLGENGAGKSTLVKILAGSYKPDAGSIVVGDQSFSSLDPIIAKKVGLAMIFQEIADAPDLSVAENISLGRWPLSRGIVDWAEMDQVAKQALANLGGSHIDVNSPVRLLTIGQRQLIEIARNIMLDARVLVLDEPTAALSSSEVDQLFTTIEKLKAAGVAMVYITHRLDEVARIGDRVQVLRDGHLTLNEQVSSVTREEMVAAMIGREGGGVVRPTGSPEFGAAVIEVDALSSGREVEDVTFSCREGEILALYGKIGSGTSETVESLFGLRPELSGVVKLFGRNSEIRSPATAVKQSLGFLPADRKRGGIFGARSVAENLSAPSWPIMNKLKLVLRPAEWKAFRSWKDRLKIRSDGDPGQLIATLSGGNQQKVLLARWFQRKSRILLLVEPTRGVDVGARADIYEILRQSAKEDRKSVIVATSDADEVVQLADRVLVMDRARIQKQLTGDEITPAALALAVGN